MTAALQIMIPHQPPMRLVDDLLFADSEAVICRLVIREDNVFYDKTINGIYAWIGIEIMAQTVASYAGAGKPGQTPKIGFLLSVRKYAQHQQYFAIGDELIISAKKDFLHENIGVFTCEIQVGGKLAASAILNIIEPPADKVEGILKGQKL